MCHVNKYAAFAKAEEVREAYHQRKTCGDKKPFETKLEAIGNIQKADAYICRFCGKWHATGLAFRIANGIKKRRDKKKSP